MARKKDMRNLSMSQLQNEVNRRRTQVSKLRTTRAKLAEQLERIEQRIAEHQAGAKKRRSGAASGQKPGAEGSADTRAGIQGGGPLADMLHQVLSSDEPSTVTQAAEKVRKAGYKTRAKNFRSMVSQTLNRDPRFERVERGKYIRTPVK